jgi:hypothetical protein
MHIVGNLLSLSFTSISVSNLFTIVRSPTLATMAPRRATNTMPTCLNHQHWNKCWSCKHRCCKLCNRPWQTGSKLGEFQWTKPSMISHSIEPMDANDWLKTIKKKLQVVQCTNRERVLFVAHQLVGLTVDWCNVYVEDHEEPVLVVLKPNRIIHKRTDAIVATFT